MTEQKIKNLESHIFQCCRAKPQIHINSISLEPPTSGLMGGGIEGLFDFLTSS